MRRSSLSLGVVGILIALVLAGCSSSSKPVSVSLSPGSAQTIDQGKTVNITATVANDSSNKGVTWSLTGSGTLTNQTATGVTYDAPASVSSPATATVTATSAASSTATAQISITVNPAPQVTTTSLPAASEYTAYSTTLQASGGTGSHTWSISSGSLPAWASLNASTGAIAGTPNAAATANFSVIVTDSEGVASASEALSLTVNPPPALSITTTSLPNGTAGTAYTATLAATGGFGAYTWSATGLPAWATINASTGVITGMPNASGTTNISVTVKDSQPTPASATANLSIAIAAPPPLTITTTSLANGTAGTAYSATLAASGGVTPYTWSATGLPAWATINASTGVITGMPNASGTTNVSVKVTDSEATPVSVTANLSITIAAAPALTISTTSLPNGNVGTVYAATLQATGGVQPYTWSISGGALPTWASLDATTGAITGDPDAQGTTNFTVQVTDSSATPVSTTQALSITINAAAGPNDSELNGQYAFLLQGFNDTTGYQFAIVGSFVADGSGNVTSGLIDVNGPSPSTAVTITGTYSVGSDNRGTLTLNGSDSSSRTFAIAVGSLNTSSIATKASMIEFDDTNGTSGNRGSGSIYLQDTAAFSLSSISGPYAFLFSGQENAVGSGLVDVGAFTADGSGNVTNGDLDSNASGTVGSGTFTATISTGANTSSFGRLTLTLTSGGTATNVVYVVAANRLLIMSTDSEITSGLTSGEIRAQSSSSFTDSSFSAATVIYNEGQGSTSGDSQASVGLLTPNGSGSVSINIDQNDSGTTTTQTGTYSYSVASNGRISVTGGSGHQPVLYLVGNNKGFFMSTGGSVSAGAFEAQSGGPFTLASVSGNYFFGFAAPGVTAEPVSSGVATSTGNGTLTSTGDVSGPGGVLITAQSLSVTLTAGSNGRFTDNQGNIYYVISPSKVVAINSSNTTPDVTTAQQ